MEIHQTEEGILLEWIKDDKIHCTLVSEDKIEYKYMSLKDPTEVKSFELELNEF